MGESHEAGPQESKQNCEMQYLLLYLLYHVSNLVNQETYLVGLEREKASDP